VIEYANAAAERLIGLREGELTGATLWRLVPGLHSSLEASLADSSVVPVVAREIELSYPQPRIIRLYMVAVPDRGGDREIATVHRHPFRHHPGEAQHRAFDRRRANFVGSCCWRREWRNELGNPLNSLTISSPAH